jgi:putative membrane protein
MSHVGGRIAYICGAAGGGRFNQGSAVLVSDLFTLPAFVAYLALGVLYFVAFVVTYIWITPQREMALIRDGNLAAAISLGGAAIGFVQPLTSAIAHSVNLLDLALWGLVAWAVQLLTHFILRLIVRDLREKIEADVRSVALFVAVVAICVGAINAAAMTY